ncbi:MAG TPA: hypothetical protein VIC33_00230, partial [Vicinamibacterales bacterium]
VAKPDDIGAAWDRAMASDRPVVLEALTDPDVPPLPPHITLEQARAFSSSVLSGDAQALGFIKETMKQAADSILPGRRRP